MARIVAVLAFLGLGTGAASAAAAIAFSPYDEHSGWATRFGSIESEAAAVAIGECARTGGAACEAVVVCPGSGFGAIAVADMFARGGGMVCGLSAAYDARVYALALCARATRTLCWTAATFATRGGAMSRDSDVAFDVAYYTQQMLYFLKISTDAPDGRIGPRTREAVRTFEARIGWPVDGEVDDELFYLLLDAVGGTGVFITALTRLVDEVGDEFADISYAASPEPHPAIHHSQRIAQRGDLDRRRSLAAMLSNWGFPCAMPAVSATPVPGDGTGFWNVTCAEGAFTVRFDDESWFVNRP